MKYAFTNGYVLDGTMVMKPKKDLTIFVEDEKIVKVVKGKTSFEGYKVINLKGQYLLPGLINLHLHLPSSGKPKKKEKDPRKTVNLVTKHSLLTKCAILMCQNFAKTQLLSGVTTIRTMGGVLNFDSLIRNKINNHKALGPRILAADMAISVPGGHMAGSLAYAAKDEKEARKYVKMIAVNKPDVIKLMITGGVLDAKKKGEPGVLRMKPEIVKAACEEAHKLGYKVAAHVESPEGVKVALKNGVDTIEHGAMADKEMIDLFKERKAAHICTISPALPFALFDRSISHVNEMQQYNGNVVFKGIINCAKACLANNIPVGLGTDTGCPWVTHYDMWREVNYFHKFCDVPTEYALYSATLGNARIAGIDKETGSIEEGKFADLIVCKENPLEDLSSLRKLSYVCYKGHLIKNPKVKKNKKIEKELDKFI